MYSYDWSGWHVGTGSPMLSRTAEARVEGRRRSRHLSNHQQGDGRVRVQVESVLGRFSIDNVPPPPTLHLCDAARSKHRYIHIRPEVVGWAPLGDLAPQSTSFGTVALRERQHLAMAATCPEGEAWAASRNWNHGTHFLWDPRAAPTFHPLSTLRHRAQCRTFHFQPSTVVQRPCVTRGYVDHTVVCGGTRAGCILQIPHRVFVGNNIRQRDRLCSLRKPWIKIALVTSTSTSTWMAQMI